MVYIETLTIHLELASLGITILFVKNTSRLRCARLGREALLIAGRFTTLFSCNALRAYYSHFAP